MWETFAQNQEKSSLLSISRIISQLDRPYLRNIGRLSGTYFFSFDDLLFGPFGRFARKKSIALIRNNSRDSYTASLVATGQRNST